MRLAVGVLDTSAVIAALDDEHSSPLLYQGRDFGRADVSNAMSTLGYSYSAAGEPQARTGSD